MQGEATAGEQSLSCADPEPQDAWWEPVAQVGTAAGGFPEAPFTLRQRPRAPRASRQPSSAKIKGEECFETRRSLGSIPGFPTPLSRVTVICSLSGVCTIFLQPS